MARNLFGDGPYVDVPITLPAAITPGAILPLWPAASWTPIYANDPKAGKIYVIKAAGLITMSVNTALLVITPKYGTGGDSLGANAAQTLPVMSALPWTLSAELHFTFIGVGDASKCYLFGTFNCQGTLATPGAGTTITFGGTLATVDATILSNVEINVTLSGTVGAPSMQTVVAYIFSRN